MIPDALLELSDRLPKIARRLHALLGVVGLPDEHRELLVEPDARAEISRQLEEHVSELNNLAQIAISAAEVEEVATTAARIEAERDRLRDEVVALRGDVAHDFDLGEPSATGKTQWRCRTCGVLTQAPTHAYFAPCKRKADGIPEHFLDSIERWVREASWPGDFLGSLIAGHAQAAWLRADGEARQHFEAIVGFLAMHVPAWCQGSSCREWTGNPEWTRPTPPREHRGLERSVGFPTTPELADALTTEQIEACLDVLTGHARFDVEIGLVTLLQGLGRLLVRSSVSCIVAALELLDETTLIFDGLEDVPAVAPIVGYIDAKRGDA